MGAPPFPSVVQHVSATISYANERAERFVHDEAKQLPTDAPGILVADVSGLPGAFLEWRPLITPPIPADGEHTGWSSPSHQIHAARRDG